MDVVSRQLVLVVEDEVQDVERLEAIVQPYGLATHVARRSFEAEAFLKRQGSYSDAVRPTLVLLDWKLPGGGASVLNTIRTTDALKATPVVVLSRSGADLDVTSAYEGGCNLFVVKPADLDEYERKLRFICDLFLFVAKLPPPIMDEKTFLR